MVVTRLSSAQFSGQLWFEPEGVAMNWWAPPEVRMRGTYMIQFSQIQASSIENGCKDDDG
jgi:hypothetical protein